jgi:hypothetical protein
MMQRLSKDPMIKNVLIESFDAADDISMIDLREALNGFHPHCDISIKFILRFTAHNEIMKFMNSKRC